MGNSRGGSIALDTAVEFPERVAALVTIGSSIGGLQRRLTPEEALRFDERERLARSGDVEAMVELDLRLWVDGPGQPLDRVPTTSARTSASWCGRWIVTSTRRASSVAGPSAWIRQRPSSWRG